MTVKELAASPERVSMAVKLDEEGGTIKSGGNMIEKLSDERNTAVLSLLSSKVITIWIWSFDKYVWLILVCLSISVENEVSARVKIHFYWNLFW